MIPEDVLKNIRRIQIYTSRMVTNAFAGHYQSVFKGMGMEFEEVREYQPGDEIRSIDWNVTARMGHPFVKKFTEERELTIMLLLDISGSSYFGTVNKLKSGLAAELCSVLALSAVKNNDRVGLIAFTDRIEKFVPPRKGLRHVLRIIREALYYEPEGKGTDIPGAMEHLNRMTNGRAVTFVISDFYDKDFKKPLSIANKRHDVIALSITDPRELDLPDIGIINLEDAETGESCLVDTSSQAVRNIYRADALKMSGERTRLFRSINVDHIGIRTDVPYLQSLYTFFRMRERRR
ncbi:hypothetical protein BMS3Abin09_00349 [bacterium BMS3Abin09]|nr:hypothetical protein BMS3Abin09_00349 [bacterium BMS3Abin09]GBE41235.1 hypothetical protein BMS3Bbin09_01126 [bacterium BMS3Bbin09]